jgi:hypothetical protein
MLDATPLRLGGASRPRADGGFLWESIVNGPVRSRPAIRAALGTLDARIRKLDPGPTERVNGVRYDVNRLVASYRALKPYTVQAMVTRGKDWDGASPENVAAWLGLLARAEPDAVQVHSLARAPADPALQKNIARASARDGSRHPTDAPAVCG